MTERREDLEASLADIDRKLRDLQAELQVVAVSDEPPAPPAAASPAPPADALEDRLAELTRRAEDLSQLSAELEEATRALLGP